MPGQIIPYNFARGNAYLYRDLAKYLDNSAERAYAILRIAANVAQGESVSLGNDVFLVDLIQTNSGRVTAGGLWNNTHHSIRVPLNIPALVPGDVILVGTELMKVVAKDTATPPNMTLLRGYAGTTIAVHADGVAIYTSAAPGTLAAVAHHFVIPVTALTPAAFTPSLVALLQSHVGDNDASGQVTAITVNNNTIMVAMGNRGQLTLALAETLAGAGNVWDTNTLQGGQPANRSRIYAGQHVVTAAQVTAGLFVKPHDFAANPSAVLVQLRTAAGVYKAWDGALTFVAPTGDPTPDVPGYAIFALGTSSPFAAGDVMNFILVE